jgi:hypothetical protein
MRGSLHVWIPITDMSLSDLSYFLVPVTRPSYISLLTYLVFHIINITS